MSAITGLLYPGINGIGDFFKQPTEAEKRLGEMQRTFAELKEKHEQFLRDREAKERRLLYAIAEKLGIDTENI